MSFTRPISAVAASLAIALAVAACGGASTPKPSSGASSAPSTGASAEPSTGASAEPSTEPSSGGASAAPSIDVGGAAAALEDIDSYRMKITSDAGSFEALVIRKPEPAREITITDGSDVTKMVIIGDEAWLAEGDGEYTPVPAAMVGGLTGMFDPLLLVGAAEGWGGGWADVGTEEKNGVQARHLHIDDTTAGGLVTGFPAGAAVDIWVAEDGYLVAWESTGLGSDTAIDISNVNDPENKVEAPN